MINMRNTIQLIFIIVLIGALSSCALWPKELKPLAKSISQQTGGEATAWLLGGDVVVIDVANSPLYQETERDLEYIVNGIAEQAAQFPSTPIVSMAITFHEKSISEIST